MAGIETIVRFTRSSVPSAKSVTIYKDPAADSQYAKTINLALNEKLILDAAVVTAMGPTGGKRTFYRIIAPKNIGWYIPTGSVSANPTNVSEPQKTETKKNPGEDTKTSAPNKVTGPATSADIELMALTVGNDLKAKYGENADKVIDREKNIDARNFIESTPAFASQVIDTEYCVAIDAFTNAFGSPFLFSNDTDPCYFHINNEGDYKVKNNVGRTMLSTLYSTPAVFSIGSEMDSSRNRIPK